MQLRPLSFVVLPLLLHMHPFALQLLFPSLQLLLSRVLRLIACLQLLLPLRQRLFLAIPRRPALAIATTTITTPVTTISTPPAPRSTTMKTTERQ